VNDKKDTQYYLGKRIAYIYKATDKIHKKNYKCIWGRIGRAHGTNGVVIARFAKNLPPKA
jgi:large subunit ribosomal protein L35Ae